MKEDLEIFCDASMHQFTDTGRVFTCSGTICRNTAEERYTISQDSTNNRGELFAIYLGIKLAEETWMREPYRYDKINLYSDSQFGIFGIKIWMNNWIKHQDSNGVIYGSNGKPVINQELFMMIITYLVTHNLVIHFYHQKGHINTNQAKQLALANKVFKQSNGFWLSPEDIFKISFYNDIVDKNSRRILSTINQYDYPVLRYDGNKDMCKYIIPSNYKDFIK